MWVNEIVRVLVADDHKIIRDGLASLIGKEPDMEVVAEAGNGRMAIEAARLYAPDVVLMDLTMPEMGGIEATRHISSEFPGMKVLALSMHSERLFIEEVLAAGAKGFLLKDCAFDELSGAIRAVMSGGTYLSPSIAGLVVKGCLGKRASSMESLKPRLTPRESEVLQLLAEGKNTKEVAFCLEVSAKTVETQRTQIMRKLKIGNIAELTKYAIREGFTTLD